ncbi:hypothetical protein IL306_002184 [Fusarium sp. DS 682]|nr:hypothetical protein IL306_002184 [Fusarium sp. DS 682]
MKLAPQLLRLLFGLSPALAHYKWPALIIDDQVTADYQYVRENTNNINPLMDVTSVDLRCNQGGLDSGSRTKTATVAAGSKIGFTLSNSISHVGPIMVYMAKAPGDPSDWDGAGLLKYEFAIPKAVPSGKYLVRVEHLGVHNAANYGGAQFFVACGQVEVTGGGSGNPGPLVAFPGAYSADDPGIYFNTYYPAPKSYVIPGPPVWTG